MRLLGTVQASDGTQALQRFPSRAVAALLARLACSPEQAHAREELVELLWPGVERAVGRNRLRQALSTLKSLLEGTGGPAAAVLLADRVHVRVVPGALGSDVHMFRQLARAGRMAEAHALYGGEFMPGFYDEWIDETRLELAAQDERLAERLQRAAPVSSPQAPAAQTHPSPSSAASSAPSSSASAPAAALPSAAATGAPALATRTQLPHYLTRLVGAEAALAALQAQVLRHRLVSLIGPGGSGKTRLAVETAHALAQAPAADSAAPRFDLVAFVPLAACASRAEALDAVLGALRLGSAADAAEAVAQALQGRRALLLLDNFEQLVEAARDAVARWLAELPNLHVLVTSRRPLALDGEREVAAEVLPLPPREATLAEAAANPAVALFVERARAARADFHLGERNAAVLVALVRALEGMPLALELAASRVRSIAPAEMLERLRGPGAPRLELLARSGPRGAFDARHASMQRVIAWSWDQLDAAQRQWLAGLTAFPGGFTAQAASVLAEALTSGDGAAATGNGAAAAPAAAPAAALTPAPAAGDSALAALDELVAHSLLTARAGDSDVPTRFAMYEPIREFAAREGSAAEHRRARAALRRWAQQWARALPATPPLERVREEMPNLVAALAGAVADGAPEDAIALLAALSRCLQEVELPAEGLAHACRAAEATGDPALAAVGHGLIGPLLFDAGQAEAALAHAEQALACAQLEPRQRARALRAAARIRWRSRNGVHLVLPMLDEAQRLLGPPPDPAAGAEPDELELHAAILALRAFVVIREQRRHDAGEQLHGFALRLWEGTGNQHAINSGRYNLAVCAQNAHRNAEALQRLTPVIDSARALGDWRRLAHALNVRGNALGGLRRWDGAAADHRECVRIAWRGMSHYDLAYGLWNLPRALLHLRRPQQAVPLFAFAERHWRRNFGELNEEDHLDLRRIRRLAARQLPPRQARVLEEQGAALTLAEAVALALA